MKDILFYPLAALAAAGLVMLALEPFADRPPTGPVSAGNRNPEDITITGKELHRFLPGPSGVLDVESNDFGDALLRITRFAEQVYDDPRQGPHLVLAEDVENALASRPIEVIVEARSSGEFGASAFEMDYLARTSEQSGWVSFPLTPEFQSYTLTWFTPPRGDDIGYDYIGVRPVTPDKRRSMEIRSVRLRATGPRQIPGFRTDTPPPE